MILGSVFLGVKVIEYQDKFANHDVPGDNYDFAYHERHAAAEGHPVGAARSSP